MAKTGPFTFTVTDLARFLGKSPVTLRSWERKGIIDLPRDPSGDRKLTITQVMSAAYVARENSRISEHRLHLIGAAVTLINLIEKENRQ